ncbi:MAG: VanZ family protein [Candidatus Omnitrophota bacterium]|nr:MAG: VanZ family protein [Candidatus Omnitrophota bacterium]
MDNIKKQAWFKYYLPSYLYAGLIFTLSSYSLVVPPSLPSFSDKWIHFVEYTIFGLLLARSYLNAKTNFLKQYFIIVAFLTGSICAFFDEYYQSFVPLRGFETLDLLADMLGILSGVMIYKAAKYLSKGTVTGTKP